MRNAAAKLRLAAAAAVLGCIWLAMLLLGGGPLDRSIYQSLYSGGHPALIAIGRVFTALGEPTVLVIGEFLVGRGLTEAQKYWVARARPDLEPHLVLVQTSSFPSGHATSSMIFYLTLALAIAPAGWRRVAARGAIVLSFLIGLSRVMLGVHWPSDVIGGWCFGLLWVLVTLRPAERLFRNPTKQV